MRIAYFDCFSGASGDMILGAFLDAGLELETLRAELAKMDFDDYFVGAEKVVKKGLGGTQAIVDCDHDHHHGHSHSHEDHKHDHHHAHEDHKHDHHHGHEDHKHDQHHTHSHGHKHNRNLHDIELIINTSSLSDTIKQKSLRIFRRLAEAEARVHRTSIDDIHFHEVGAVDAIVDIVGAVIGLEALGIGKIYCSPLHVGSGTVECAHGTLPVPAPATMELIKGKPIYSTGVKGELLTPTGAAILTTLANEFGPMPAMTVEMVGYGAGTSEPAVPNLLRVAIGRMPDMPNDGYEMERMAVIETSIDDMDPRIYDSLIDNLLQNGAMDVYLLPIQMKKNRPGTMVTAICPPEIVWKISDILIRETTTIGLRWRVDERIKTSRKIEKIETVYGPVSIKVAEVGGRTVNISAEYDDCKRIAREKNIPLKEVIEQTTVAIKGRK